MDCCICSPVASMFRPPRNTICHGCYVGARSMVNFLNELYSSQEDSTHRYQSNEHKGMSLAFKRIKEMNKQQDKMEEMVKFLGRLVLALREGAYTDILIKPANGSPIPAHKALLATRSEIFGNMLSSDECKAPAGETIALPELTHDELHCLLEFLYTGSLSAQDTQKHSHSLLVAADKYDIPFLRKHCEHQIMASLTPANALDVLELAELCSNDGLKRQAMESIVKHVEDVVFSDRYETFAVKNGHLCVEITRAVLMEMKGKDGATTMLPANSLGD